MEILLRQRHFSHFAPLFLREDQRCGVTSSMVPTILHTAPYHISVSNHVTEETCFCCQTPRTGTPVTCLGLRLNSMTHLNGKIGEIRDYSEDYRICLIHFEEEGLEPAEVKLENVRILFDLPEKE